MKELVRGQINQEKFHLRNTKDVRWLGNDVLLYQRALMTQLLNAWFILWSLTDLLTHAEYIIGQRCLWLTHITKQDHRQDDWISTWPYSDMSYTDREF